MAPNSLSKRRQTIGSEASLQSSGRIDFTAATASTQERFGGLRASLDALVAAPFPNVRCPVHRVPADSAPLEGEQKTKSGLCCGLPRSNPRYARRNLLRQRPAIEGEGEDNRRAQCDEQ